MEYSEEQVERGYKIARAILANDCAKVEKLFGENPWLLRDYRPGDSQVTWIKGAASQGHIEVMALLLGKGLDIDALHGKEKGTALDQAISFDQDKMVEYLLARGANPNLSRPLIGAMSFRKTPERQMKFVRLLVEHGADVNRLYDLYGSAENSFTALDWASDPAVNAYLRSKGAKTKQELLASSKNPKAVLPSQTPPAPISFAEEVAVYCEKQFGKIDEASQAEVIPLGHPISIHAARGPGKDGPITLFTTGLSSQPMRTPAQGKDYELAEIFVQLPKGWRYDLYDNPKWNWPAHWLRQVAQYPHEHRTWLGGPMTIIANDDPPKPLARGVKFTSLLLLAQYAFKRSDGKTVQLYRMLPIYTDERALELQHGAPALMRALDRYKVPFVLDINRPSVASQGKKK